MSFGDLKTIFQFDSFRDYYVVLALLFAMAFGFVVFCKSRVYTKGLPPVWFMVLMGLAAAAGVAAIVGIGVFFTNYDFPTVLKVLLTIVYAGAICLCICVGMLLGGFILQPILNLHFKYTFHKNPILQAEFIEPALRDKANKVFICGSYCEYDGINDRVMHFHDFDLNDLNPLGQKLFTQVMRSSLRPLGRYHLRPAESNGFYYMTEEEIMKSHFFESGYELINARYKRDEERRDKIARKKGILPQTDEVAEYMDEVSAVEPAVLVDAKEGNLAADMFAEFGEGEVIPAAMEPAVEPAAEPEVPMVTVDKTPAALRLEQETVAVPAAENLIHLDIQPAPNAMNLPLVPEIVEDEVTEEPMPLLLQAEEAQNAPEPMAEPKPTLILTPDEPAAVEPAMEETAEAAPAVEEPVAAEAAEEEPKAAPEPSQDTKKVMSLEEMIAAQVAEIEKNKNN